MIYQLVNKRAEILAITFHIARLCDSYNHVFVLLIFMPRFNSVSFFRNKPKIKLFLTKNTKILECWGLRPQTPATAPPSIADFWLRACLRLFRS